MQTTYLQPLRSFLGKKYPQPTALWNYGEDNSLAEGWLLATPPGVWDKSYAGIPMPIRRDDDAFGLKEFRQGDAESDFVFLDSTVKRPGEAARRLAAGHSWKLYEAMYHIITGGETLVDITLLCQPSGAFAAMLRNALTYISQKPDDKKPVVRLLVSDPLPLYRADKFLPELVRDIPAAASLEIYAAAYKTSVASWNHAKIVAADGQYCLTGGHNMWGGDYLEETPVFDLSMRLGGSAALHAHDFAEGMWKELERQRLRGDSPHLFARLERSGDARGNVIRYGICPEPKRYEALRVRMCAVEAKGCVPVLSIGRAGDIGAGRFHLGVGGYWTIPPQPSDDVFIELIRLARSSVKFSLQAFQTFPIAAGCNSRLFVELGRAMLRGVTVEAVLSNPGGLTAGYAGNAPEEINLAMLRHMLLHLRQQKEMAHRILTDLFHIAVIRYAAGEETYPQGKPIPNHAKLMIVDEQVFYIGSQNQYNSNLNEFGYLIEDEGKAKELLAEYWEPLWAQSKRTVVHRYSEKAEDVGDQEAAAFLMELQCNTRLRLSWEDVLAQKTDAENRDRVQRQLEDCIRNAGFATTPERVNQLLCSSFFLENYPNILPNDESDRFVRELGTNRKLLEHFFQLLKREMDAQDPLATVNQWLREESYACTAQQAAVSFQQLRQYMLTHWRGRYKTILLDKQDRTEAPIEGPVLDVTDNTHASLDEKALPGISFSGGLLRWTEDAADWTGSIYFGEISRPGLSDRYAGKECFGTVAQRDASGTVRQFLLSGRPEDAKDPAVPKEPEANEEKRRFLKVLGVSLSALALLTGLSLCGKKASANGYQELGDTPSTGGDIGVELDSSNATDLELDDLGEGERIEATQRERRQQGIQEINPEHPGGMAENLHDFHTTLKPEFAEREKSLRQKAREYAKTLPWRACTDEIDRILRDKFHQMAEADRALYTKSPDVVVTRLLDAPEVQAQIREMVRDFVMSGLPAELAGEHGEVVVRREVEHQMLEAIRTGGTGLGELSYQQATAEHIFLEQRAHDRLQHLQETQQALSHSAAALDQAEREIAQRETRMRQVRAELSQKGENAPLQKEASRLDAELRDLRERGEMERARHEKIDRDRKETRERQKKEAEELREAQIKQERARDFIRKRKV